MKKPIWSMALDTGSASFQLEADIEVDGETGVEQNHRQREHGFGHLLCVLEVDTETGVAKERPQL